jgi:hypothetical protein
VNLRRIQVRPLLFGKMRRRFASGAVSRRPVSITGACKPPWDRRAAAHTTCAACGRTTRSSARKGEQEHKAGKHQESLDTLAQAEKLLGIQ